MRVTVAAGSRTLTRAAASSIASGRPSSRTQIWVDGSDVAGVDSEVAPNGLGALDEQVDGGEP